jgi:hypothetical protein
MRCGEFIALLWEHLYPPKQKITIDCMTGLLDLSVVKSEKRSGFFFMD